ncbi:cilia- and flagella-associated protein 418 [Heterodontus francisci]|uniref:cilia- and flagella-associated protein 418 n=1 Tax=Heterodontus francisci TaxID=7792 RepID=UPI00355B4A9F
MADDLDQLLDEVELRFCRDRSATSREEKEEAARVGGSDKEVKISSTSVSPEETTKEEDDLSDLIEDIFHDNPSVSDPSKSSPRAITNCVGHRAFSQTKGRKCFPVYLGGSSAPLGLGTNTSQRTCDQLRCTTCDFRVIALDDYEWNKSCDYFFFRNNMPDLNKLKVKTLSKRGARAYACQCSWRSIHDLTDLREEQQLRWVCGKH